METALGWSVIALGTAWVIGGLLSLIRGGHSRRPPWGAHARPEPAAEPRAHAIAAATDIRKSLLVVATGAVWLVTIKPGHRMVALAVGIAVVGITAWELADWLSVRRTGAQTAAWREFPFVVAPALPALVLIARGWSYTDWLIGALGATMIAAEADKWFRSRMVRKQGKPTAEPPSA